MVFFFLTDTRQTQYNLAMIILKNDIKRFDEIAKISVLNKMPTNPSDYVNLPFFTNWIVGFTVAEGSFFIKSNNDGCFSLKQRIHIKRQKTFLILLDYLNFMLHLLDCLVN